MIRESSAILLEDERGSRDESSDGSNRSIVSEIEETSVVESNIEENMVDAAIGNGNEKGDEPPAGVIVEDDLV